MDTFDDILRKIVNDTANHIKGNLGREHINASGRTSRGIKVQAYGRGYRIAWTDGAPQATTEIGRAGGRVPVGFRHILEQWTRDKGLSFETERERSTFAYFLAKRIAAQGTLRHAEPVDVYTTPTNNAVEKIKAAYKERAFGSFRQFFRIRQNVAAFQPFAETIKILKSTPKHDDIL